MKHITTVALTLLVVFLLQSPLVKDLTLPALELNHNYIPLAAHFVLTMAVTISCVVCARRVTFTEAADGWGVVAVIAFCAATVGWVTLISQLYRLSPKL